MKKYEQIKALAKEIQVLARFIERAAELTKLEDEIDIAFTLHKLSEIHASETDIERILRK